MKIDIILIMEKRSENNTESNKSDSSSQKSDNKSSSSSSNESSNRNWTENNYTESKSNKTSEIYDPDGSSFNPSDNFQSEDNSKTSSNEEEKKSIASRAHQLSNNQYHKTFEKSLPADSRLCKTKKEHGMEIGSSEVIENTVYMSDLRSKHFPDQQNLSFKDFEFNAKKHLLEPYETYKFYNLPDYGKIVEYEYK